MTTPASRAKERRRAHRELPFASPEEVRQNLEKLLVISDTHWFHRRLTEVLAPGSRPDNNHTLMLERWYEAVTPDTPVLHLGDVVVGISPEEINTLLPSLPGNVYLVDGNHDTIKKLHQFVARGWKLLDPFCAEYRDWILYFTHEPRDVPLGAINVHGHIHSNAERDLQHLNCSVENQDLRPMHLCSRLDLRIGELEKAGFSPLAQNCEGDLESKVAFLEGLPSLHSPSL